MGRKGYRVIEDPVWGYKRLDPIPDSTELTRFYQSRYCDLVRGGGRAPEIQRLLAGGKEAEREAAWLTATVYSDVLQEVEANLAGQETKRALDVGCGTGEFVAFLKAAGWDAMGIEPASEVARAATARGLHVLPLTLEEYLERWTSEESRPFGLISLFNVLEHVPDPVTFLRKTEELVAPGSLLMIRVPNDFNEFQLVAQRTLKKEPWWIAIPDHVNYFNHESLCRLLERLGWDVVHLQADFPMELFLIMGEDYVGNPEVGARCHEKRQRFEMSLPRETRQRWYRALADVGLGRESLVIAKRSKS